MKRQSVYYEVAQLGYCVPSRIRAVVFEVETPGGPLDPANPADPDYVRLGIGPFIGDANCRPTLDAGWPT